MKKILIVDDSNSVCDFLREILEAAGFSVDTFNNGYAFLAHLQQGTEPDGVVLDLRMPGKDGTELLYGLRCKWKNTKIFIFSGYTEFEGSLDIRDYTCGFFAKANGADKLVEAIKKELAIE